MRDDGRISIARRLPVGLNDSGAGLGMLWGREEAIKALNEAGFTDVSLRRVEGDPHNGYFIAG